MKFIKHWPEVLFVVLIMFGPLGIAFFLSNSLASFFVLLIAGMALGFAAWIAIVILMCRLGDGTQEETTEQINDTLE